MYPFFNFCNFWQHSLITMNLKQVRQKQGVTQAEMAQKLGVSRPTYIQIERGEKEPTVSQARIIAELFQSNESRETEKKSKLAKKAKNKQGTQFDPYKFKEVLLYVLERVGAKANIGETALYKLLYFIDFDFYEKYGKPLAGATYMKNRHGPTPRQFKPVTDEMIQEGELERVKSKYFQYDQKKYLPLREPRLEAFTVIEIKHIDDVLARLSEKNAFELSTYSHEDIPWQVTDNQNDIDYQLVFQRCMPYAQHDYDAMMRQASAYDILKELGPMSDEEYNYYENL